MNNLEIIRAACVKANPAAKGRLMTFADIRLADVLLAITNKIEFYGEDFTILADGTMLTKNGEVKWNLLNDNLSAQSEECLAFLAGLLKSED